MTFCIPQGLVDQFKGKLKNGEINPEKLASMTSEQRRAEFSFLGDTNAQSVNALFESKLLLKNQQTGIINWAKKVIGMKPEVLRDIVSKVNRLEKVLEPKDMDSFLEDLAAQKLGFDVTFEEAGKIAELSRGVSESRTKVSDSSPVRSTERMEYGTNLTLFKDYIGDLKLHRRTMRERITHPLETVVEVGGMIKSAWSTFDNSFFGRQGIKVLYTHPEIWTRNFLKSWGDIGKELMGRSAMLPIKADIYSRPNALNGLYSRSKLDIGIGTEEAFPSALPERIPILGRLFKGSESAFNGAALRMRSDIMDKLARLADKQGVDLTDTKRVQDFGAMVNALTGRGKTSWFTPQGTRGVNATLFSMKFLKSQFDVLSQPFNRNMDPFVRKQAAYNLLKIVGGVAAVNLLAQLLLPGEPEKDPRSSAFGKIRIGKTLIDTTGGMASIITLASRLMPTKHKGDWGWWTKSATTGKVTSLTSGKFGATTALDVFENFWEGKLSPLAGIVRDIWKGTTYRGDKVTAKEIFKNLALPLSVQNFRELMKSPDNDKIILFMILDGLGFSTQPPFQKKKN